ncbi:hypothetical protein E2C01_079433 [Portunus trituberculatus]|uniref:Uncharacterized protein n=1 Tax=Portunus trituberculatus TaxID=210409 RepID=A0A5B7IVM2_PORTR|nr:hypothetical protein [Portunus trituberculatus]
MEGERENGGGGGGGGGGVIAAGVIQPWDNFRRGRNQQGIDMASWRSRHAECHVQQAGIPCISSLKVVDTGEYLLNYHYRLTETPLKPLPCLLVYADSTPDTETLRS